MSPQPTQSEMARRKARTRPDLVDTVRKNLQEKAGDSKAAAEKSASATRMNEDARRASRGADSMPMVFGRDKMSGPKTKFE